MITFHKLTQHQYEMMLSLSGQVTDGLYFLTDVGVIKLHNGGESVTTFGTSVKIVNEFPDSNNAQMYCIYTKADTKEKRMWDGTGWQILSYPITNLITSGIALSSVMVDGQEVPVTTVPNTYAVYNFVQDRVAAAELGVQVRLHTPVHTSGQLVALPLDDVEDKCMILVLTIGLYRYDANSYDYDDPETDAVITPQYIIDQAGELGDPSHIPGRWIKMFNNVGYVASSGVLISANPNDTNQIIALDVNTEQFTFVDGKLNINPDADFVGQKVDKVFNKQDLIATWREDGNQDPSGYKFNKTDKLTNLSTSISPDSVISTFVHEITDKKLDDVRQDSDGKIIVGSGNNGKVDASLYDIGTDNDNFHGHIQNIPLNRVATERAVKWYVDRSLSFNKDDLIAETSGGIPPTELGD